jgi:DNA-binding response OmpR family regulator
LSARILVAEDDEKQSRLIRIYLEREGNAVQVVADGRAALERARSTGLDLIVLDVMLPLVDGLDVCRILRAEAFEVPILLLTARSTEEDMLLGLDLGADDYLTKPYSPRELTARVRALLRRSRKGGAAGSEVLLVGAVELDTARFEVRVAGRPVVLTSRSRFPTEPVDAAVSVADCGNCPALRSTLRSRITTAPAVWTASRPIG